MATNAYQTNIVSHSIDPGAMPVPTLKDRVLLRQASADEWIDAHASGTLRKNKKLGFAWHDHYLHERVAYEFGFGFEVLPSSRVTVGRPYTEGDCHAITESGWHIERYLTLAFFPEDKFEAAYLQIEEADGSKREGIGIFVAETSAAWIGQGKALFALIAAFDPVTGSWHEPRNPF